jgi:hypothetical protein
MVLGEIDKFPPRRDLEPPPAAKPRKFLNDINV